MNIKDLYRDSRGMRQLWCNHDAFSKTALDAINIYPRGEERTSTSAAAEFFIDYTNVFLIKKPEDFLYIFKRFKKIDDRSKFMNTYFENNLIDQITQEALLHDESTISQIGNSEEWIDLPIRLRASKLIENSHSDSLDVETILPNIGSIGSMTIEYILSWAFEESKLSARGVEFFQRNHPKKYAHLVEIKNNDLLQSKDPRIL